jgi:hypothetical protein
MAKVRKVRLVVQDPTLERLYEKWQKEDPNFASKLEESRQRQAEAARIAN